MAGFKRERNPVYRKGQTEPFKLSRSKVELFIQCPRCFWLDRKIGIKRPDSPPFLINSAVDALLKAEFDIYRKKGEPHPWQIEFEVNAKPYDHQDIDRWRHNFTGVQCLHKPTNLILSGAVDDVWVMPTGQLVVVDYKATAKAKEITDLEDSIWHDAYRRQMEFYQWLLRQNDFKVSDTGYFVYANGIANKDGFYNKVEFRTNIFPYKGKTDWVEPALKKIKQLLESDEIPRENPDCPYCLYVRRQQQKLKGLTPARAKTKQPALDI